MKKLMYLLVCLSLFSCEKVELPVKKPTIGSSESNILQLSVGSSYGNQLFFNCASESVIQVVNRDHWDVAFEASSDGFRVIPNGSRMIGVYKSPVTNFADITSYVGNEWKYDRPSGHLDSTAIGDWRIESKVYVFNMGVSVDGDTYPKYKIRIVSVDSEKYTIEYGKLTATTASTATVYKDNSKTFVHFSMLNNESINGEPAKDTWDLGFRTYTHIYPDGMPYLVVGCMLNPNETTVTKIVGDFKAITYNDIASHTFKSEIDAVGFDWKTYDFDTYLYTVHPEKNYIVKTKDGVYYKFHFLDFYDDLGKKGAPKMEIQELIP